MNKRKLYTAADFESYYAGTMPPAEMHALEKAALEDSFLADAMEGYVNTPSFKNDIAAIKQKLNKRKNKNVISLSTFTQSGWWRIAALFIIIAGAGYFFYEMNNSNKENVAGLSYSKTLEKKADSSLSLNNDSVTTNNDVAFENHQVRRFEEKHKTTLPEIKSKKENNVTKDFAFTEKSKIDENENQDSSKFLLKGKVTDEKGAPLAFATVKDNSTNKETQTDNTGNFLLHSPDSNTTAIVTATGYGTKKVRLRNDRQKTIAMDKSNENLNEVAISPVEQNQRDESTLSAEELQGKAAGVEITRALANNEQFDQYIKENVKPVHNKNNELQKGEVLLTFTIYKNGIPDKIKIVKSSCAECETEAIWLLKNGPAWEKSKDRWRTVIIKF